MERAVVLEWLPKRRVYRWVRGLDVPMPYQEAEARAAVLASEGHFIPVPVTRTGEKRVVER